MKKRFELPDDQCESMTNDELSTVAVMLITFGLFESAYRAIQKRLDYIPNGKARYRMVKGQVESLMQDIIGTISDSQRKRLQNITKDNVVQLVPRLTPDSKNVLVHQDELKMLIEEAQHKCVGCVEDNISCKKCRLYHFQDAHTPLEDYYNGFVCPYAKAKWND